MLDLVVRLASVTTEPQFLAVYGRRRIGKTFLIHEYFKNKNNIYFEVIGRKKGDLAHQLNIFIQSMDETFGESASQISSWDSAFSELHKQVSKTPKSKKIILFFDELPWLATPKSGLLEVIDQYWNKYFSRRENLILIVCGSAASWMIENIVNNKGGLHNRLTKLMHMKRFSLKETKSYLASRGFTLTTLDLIEIYMVFGGVAKYLTYLEKGLSPAQNINQICFSRSAPLKNELDNLFSSLFDHSEIHEKIVFQLASHFYGFNQLELSKKCDVKIGGRFSKYLDELVGSDFVNKYQTVSSERNQNIFRITDPFSFFASKWMNSHERYDDDYWLKKRTVPAWNSWKGLAFELIWLNHTQNIVNQLGIRAVSNHIYSWRGDQQVDLVIERADRVTHLIEMKYRESPLKFTKQDVLNLENKKINFISKLKKRNSIMKTLITTLEPVESTKAAFDQILLAEDLID